ncbi:hypothetical protein [Nocardia wallacei]|uniref:hypothetical protein n=1 Tax=Nocardia wallacei TaxID=480035 RepID=UPI0024547FA7|nr:hypothetical protein [Nocardia wallacei]
MLDVAAMGAVDWVLFWIKLPMLLVVGGFVVVAVIAVQRADPDDLPDLIHAITTAVIAVMSFRLRWTPLAPHTRRRRTRKGPADE